MEEGKGTSTVPECQECRYTSVPCVLLLVTGAKLDDNDSDEIEILGHRKLQLADSDDEVEILDDTVAAEVPYAVLSVGETL